MWWNRFFPIFLLSAALALLLGRLREPAPFAHAPPGLSFPDWKEKKADPEARAWLDRAVQGLAPQRVSWLETAVWQKVTLPDITYQAEGRLLVAPEGRFRLELTTRVGTSGKAGASTRLEVSDGVNSWSARRGDNGEWVELAKRAPGQGGAEESEPLSSPSPLGSGMFRPGLASLLGDLSERLRWVQAEALPTGQVRLTGVASPKAPVSPARSSNGKPPTPPAPSGGPRLCRVILDRETLWPARIEWWGPGKVPGQDHLLVEMEFRQPVLNRPLAPDVSARTFRLREASTVITDLTVPFFPPPEAPKQ